MRSIPIQHVARRRPAPGRRAAGMAGIGRRAASDRRAGGYTQPALVIPLWSHRYRYRRNRYRRNQSLPGLRPSPARRPTGQPRPANVQRRPGLPAALALASLIAVFLFVAAREPVAAPGFEPSPSPSRWPRNRLLESHADCLSTPFRLHSAWRPRWNASARSWTPVSRTVRSMKAPPRTSSTSLGDSRRRIRASATSTTGGPRPPARDQRVGGRGPDRLGRARHNPAAAGR